ncbi:Polyketide cyclase/dehydrase [Ferroglobus placidus DSM 10642]|uniref:Polyketide cyclase/dehydrase n=1 Tax=Ferroglobus placidus (strain DSM 10642 / AEDII12DO) TaxID=589924 RepID=D3S2T9_FERPA|nr:SRPBCC family protein [Ferroglobus placidus]ADC66651.1 Polyketide cyclase/dehydrase [Ferroglobus placidus DSM 10642]
MAEAKGEIVVSADVERVRKVLLDMKTVGSCFKFVKNASEKGEKWFVRAPMSMITQTKELEVKVIREEPVEWEAKGKHLLWKGRFEVEEANGGTRIKVTLSVEGLGSMAAIINPMASVQIEGQLRYFLNELKKKIEG